MRSHFPSSPTEQEHDQHDMEQPQTPGLSPPATAPPLGPPTPGEVVQKAPPKPEESASLDQILAEIRREDKF